ncbi:MAG: ABC transporter permease [Candidatus Baldrarchaeia archaeon]
MPNFARYLARRFITLIPTVLGVVFITFAIGYIIPSDLARAWAGGIKARPELVEELKKKYHLEDPLFAQFYFFLSGILTNSLESPTTGAPIFSILMALFPFTAQLAIMSVSIAILIGFPVGIFSALKRDTISDYLIRIWTLSMNAMPAFLLGYIIRYAVDVTYEEMGMVPPEFSKISMPSHRITGLPILDALLLGESKVLCNLLFRFFWPALTLGLIYGGIYARFIRNSVLDVLNSEFIIFLKAKGVPKSAILRHVLKNTMIPLITVIGFSFANLLGGAVLVEIVFHLPGIGSFMYNSLFLYDVVIILGTTLFFAVIVILTSLIIDILYGIIDPRIRY